MKHIKKFLQTVMLMALALCLSSVPVMAQGVTDHDIVQQENEAVTYASVPDGYILVATFSRTPETIDLGTTPVQSTSTFQLYLPNNSRKDLIQGKVIFTSLENGTEKEYSFTNMSGEYKTIDLSDLAPGIYQVSIYAYAFGTSNQATAYYKMNP